MKVELHLSGLIWTASHPDMQKKKIRVIGFFFENRLHWQFKAGNKIFTNAYFRLLYIYYTYSLHSAESFLSS